MARIALVSLFSIVRFYCIGGFIGCQYIHTGWILNATSVNKNIHNMHLFSSMSNSWFLLLGQMYVHNCYIWSLSLHGVFSYAMHQCACMGQQIFTLVAFVWLLSTVCNHMTLNNICSREGIITLVAFVRFDWMMFFLRSWAKIGLEQKYIHSRCPIFHLHMFFGSPIHLTQELLLWIRTWDLDLNIKKHSIACTIRHI